DLYKFDRALYTEKLLKKSSLDKVFTNHIDGVGYGWFISIRLHRRCIRMSGRSPGFQGELQRYVDDDDVTVIVLGNNYSGAASLLITDLAAIAFGEPYETLAVNPSLKLDPQKAAPFMGRYQGGADFLLPNASLTLEQRDGHLAMRWSISG